MPTVKDRSFWRNRFFGEKNRLQMQRYLNEMSENGYHLSGIGKFSCAFNEEASKKFTYGLSGAGEETLYASNPEWEHFLTYKNIPFFRQELKAGAVRVTRCFKKSQKTAELGWLGTRLSEGLVLVAKDGSDYYFNRSEAYKGFRYHLKSAGKIKKKKTKKGQAQETEQDIFEAERGMRFVCSCGSDYYFLRDASAAARVEKERGSRITDMLLAVIISTGSALAFTAALIFMLFGTFTASTNGKSTLPFLIGGGAASVLFGILFVLYFLKFQKVAELRKIRAEEKRARLEAQETPPQPAAPTEGGSTTTNNSKNTVVVNTLVVNSYGKDGKKKKVSSDRENAEFYDRSEDGDEFDPNLRAIMGQAFKNPALDPSAVPAMLESEDAREIAEAVVSAASAPDYEDKTEDEDDIWQGQGVFGQSKKTARLSDADDAVYIDQEPKRSHPQSEIFESFDENDEYADEEEYYEDDEEYGDDGEYTQGFPLLSFIGCALLAFISVIGFIFSVRYCISWFISGGDMLLLVLSILAVAFTPFSAYFGIKSCKYLLEENSEHLE